MLEKTRGIVLHHLKYGDSSLISHVFTREYGLKSFLTKGVRSKKSRIRANMFQVLNILDLEFYHRETRNLLLIKEVNRARIFNSFPYDVIKSTQAMFMAEVLQNCVAEGDPDIRLFGFLENALEYFDLMEDEYSNFHLAFLMKLTPYLGILPSSQSAAGEGLQGPKEFPLRENNLTGLHQISKVNSGILYELYKYDFEKSSGLSLSRDRRNLILAEILSFYTLNGYKLNKMKTLPVLKELFI